MNFSELLVVFIVALIVLGPKQLLRVAYLIGKFTQAIKRFVSQMKHSLEEDITLEDLKQSLQQNKNETADATAPTQSTEHKS